LRWHVLYYLRRSFRVKLAVLAVLAALYAAVLGSMELPPRTAWLAAAAGLLTTAAVMYVFDILFFYLRSALMKKRLRADLYEPYDYTFDTGGYATAGPNGGGAYRYETVRDIFFYRRHFVLEYPAPAYIIIPWRAVPPERRAELEEHLRSVRKELLA
jgi:hypothetical protein